MMCVVPEDVEPVSQTLGLAFSKGEQQWRASANPATKPLHVGVWRGTLPGGGGGGGRGEGEGPVVFIHTFRHLPSPVPHTVMYIK